MKREPLSREECRATQIQILDAIVEICRRNNLNYYLAYGTLLGAIRHKGFIPWDDDIDIFMPRNDYDQLISLMKSQQEEKPEWLEILDGTIENYYYPFAKAVDKTTIAKMEDNLTPHGIWIDIFPEDNLPSSKFMQKVYVITGEWLRNIIIAMTTDFSAARSGLKHVVKRCLCILASCIGKKRIYRLAVYHNTKYKNANSTKVACMSTPYGVNEILDKKRLFTPTEVEFEGKMYQTTKEWDIYLSRIYGDYMQMPPKEKRRVHSITAWKKG